MWIPRPPQNSPCCLNINSFLTCMQFILGLGRMRRVHPLYHLFAWEMEGAFKVTFEFQQPSCSGDANRPSNAGASWIGRAFVMHSALKCGLRRVQALNWDGLLFASLWRNRTLNVAFEVCSLHIGMHLVSQKAAFLYPNTFSRAKKMVKKAGHEVVSCLILGMLAYKLRYVPAFKM